MKLSVGLTIIALALVVREPVGAQAAEQDLASLRAEIEVLKTGQSAIQRDLQEIKQLLQGGAETAPVEALPERLLTVAGSPSKGEPGAKVTLIEFSDYQCPFCARHARETAAQIDAQYVSTGKVRHIFRNFPIEGIHPLAFKAHEAAGCAAEQGKFWTMHARLFGNQNDLEVAELPNHAAAIGLDVAPFKVCLETGRTASRIRQDVAEGRSMGVNGTPMFFVGLTEPNDGKVKVLRMLRGAQSLERFQEAIDSVLAEAK
jgi:protein-disulfide isomerase